MFQSRFCLIHLHFVYSCAGAVHFMRRSEFYEGQERRRAVRALKDPGAKNNVTLKANVTNSRCY